MERCPAGARGAHRFTGRGVLIAMREMSVSNLIADRVDEARDVRSELAVLLTEQERRTPVD